MRSISRVNLLCVLFTGIAISICASNTLVAQKKEADTAKPSAKAKKTAAKKSKGRLPNHYGKLNLSTEQRDKVYKIQAGYKSQIDALKKQLAELTKKRNSECEGVLTATQKSTLDKALKDAAAKRAVTKKTARK